MLIDMAIEKIITISATIKKVQSMSDDQCKEYIDNELEPRRKAAEDKALGRT
jgi:hypothetical protein